LNRRKKGILKVVLFTILLISYILGFAVIFNLREILGIGIYEGNKTFAVDINGNSCGLNVELHASYYRGDEHYYGYKLTAFSSGDVGLVGISYLSLSIRASSSDLQSIDRSYNPPIVSLSSIESLNNLYKNNNLTLIGYANIIFTVNNLNETQTIPINIGIIIKYAGGEILYVWGNAMIWIETIYLCLTVIPATLLYRTIKRIKFEKWYVQEIKNRDENFFNIL
jgi:hypothetical protein